jgi:hypothetical protein
LVESWLAQKVHKNLSQPIAECAPVILAMPIIPAMWEAEIRRIMIIG